MNVSTKEMNCEAILSTQRTLLHLLLWRRLLNVRQRPIANSRTPSSLYGLRQGLRLKVRGPTDDLLERYALS